MPVKIGYKASAEQFGPRELADYAVLADDLGFDSVTISDHFQPWRHVGGHAPNAVAWMAHVGARTRRIQLGTSVLTPTLRYHPTVVAQMFATLGALYPGRIVLGVGTGEALNEVAAGIGWPETRERFARLREAVRLIRQLWREDRVTFEGEYYNTHNATIYDKPGKSVPILIAAGGPMVARYAGRAGDGFICTSGKGRELYVDTLLPAVQEGLDARATKPERFDRMIEIKLSYDRNPKKALENTRFWAPLSLPPEQKQNLHDPVEMAAAADALPIDQVARRWIVGSSPEDVVPQLRDYISMGFNHLVLHGPGAKQERFLRVVAEDLMEQLSKPEGARSGG